MKVNPILASICGIMFIAQAGQAASAGPVFYGDPPDEHHPWAIHDGNRPQPPVVTPGTFSSPEQPGKPPSDAIILFDGSDLSKWETGKGAEPKWIVKDGIMTVAPGTGEIRTKEKFGDCQLHIEWAAPKEVKGDSQGRANSGVFMMGRVEIQVLDSYNNLTYADGHAASVYGVNPPMANALRPPGEWQVYDIVFRRPIYKGGQVLDPGHVTVFVNGVLAQDSTALEGGGTHMARTRPGSLGETGPLSLQDHGNPMRFRNIWYRKLAPRPADGGTDGYLTTEATMAKRKEIAASIREDAAKLKDPANPRKELMRTMEALVYDKDDATLQKVQELCTAYLTGLKALPANRLQGKKDEVRGVSDAFKYLAKWKIVAADYAPKMEIENFYKEQGWDKKK